LSLSHSENPTKFHEYQFIFFHALTSFTNVTCSFLKVFKTRPGAKGMLEAFCKKKKTKKKQKKKKKRKKRNPVVRLSLM
jgi:hypothetical protein